MKTNTNKLIGPTLNWTVAKCEGKNPSLFIFKKTGALSKEHNYSSDWSQGGPIIEREIAVIRKGEQSAIWFASIMDASMDYMTYEGPTPLIAAMRCYVASKLGNTIEVPDELC